MVTSGYLIQGGDGYSMLSENEGVTKGESAIHFLSGYFKEKSPIAPEEEFRIADVQQLGLSAIFEKNSTCSSSSSGSQLTSNIVIQTLLIFFMLMLML